MREKESKGAFNQGLLYFFVTVQEPFLCKHEEEAL